MAKITLWLLSVVLSALIACAACTTAQEANCTDSSYGWAFNSLGLSPCRVAEQLVWPCNTTINITQLPDTSYAYFGPSAGEADPCRCSSVYYSLLAGCAACQDARWITWHNYIKNCSAVYLTIFPRPVPSGTRVPHWAYLNVSIEDDFNPMEAAAVASSDAAAASAASSGTQTISHGAIAGAVIGSLVGVASIACILLFLYKGRKPSKHTGLPVQNRQDALSISPFRLTSSTMTQSITVQPAPQLSDSLHRPQRISPLVPLRPLPSTSDLTPQEPQGLISVIGYTGAAEV